jgi:hypothetical protein
MKLTKSHLKQLIKEELRKVLREEDPFIVPVRCSDGEFRSERGCDCIDSGGTWPCDQPGGQHDEMCEATSDCIGGSEGP